ncbi:MAG: phosphatidylserine decarboxylase [Phenylobacterium zucineum]|nr:MAG: phosphatidylserine decarboxylase [Phenylobacterium zucineum]
MSSDRLQALKIAAATGWRFTLPLIEIATTRSRGQMNGSQMNVFGHMRRLADHRARAVTTPNNDTFYSTAQVDLSQGPVTVTLPPTGDRYLSLQLMDAYTNTFAILGTRTTGNGGGTYTLVGPQDAAEGPHLVRCPTNHVWALARILVDGPHDVETARAVQQGLSMQGPPVETPGPFAHRGAGWRHYFASAAQLMKLNPPMVMDQAETALMAPLGLEDFNPDRFSPEEVAAIEAGIAEAKAASKQGGLSGAGFIDGWSYPSARLGDFGQDYALRAAVAVSGLAALPPIEAMYMRAQGDLPGALFEGLRNWVLHFPADALPPVKSFWSLSLYEATEDGQFYFTDNPINRYAIGDRTDALTYNHDGSLDIWIGHSAPEGKRATNWLPAPVGPFALFLRAYLPKPELLDGGYRFPPIRPVL